MKHFKKCKTNYGELQTKATVSEKTAVAKDVTAEKTELVKERYSDLTNKAERSIQENPLTSIAICCSIGHSNRK